jgi:nucleotide-binding universal stress UspA family protein
MRRFKNILCVITPQGDHGQVLERTVNLAEHNQARLRVVVVLEKISIGMGMPDGGPISEQLQNTLLRNSEDLLEKAIEPFRDQVEISTRVLTGTPFLEVICEVLRNKHDLVVKSAEDPEWLNRLFGSDDMHLLRKCPCPVWLFNPGAQGRFRTILAAVDVDDDFDPVQLEARRALNDQVLQLAASLAITESAQLHIGHALDAIGAGSLSGRLLRGHEAQLSQYVEQVRTHRQDSLERSLQRLPADVGPEVHEFKTHLIEGAPRKAIPALASDIGADLVVMGTVARTGIPGFIVGNTAEMILSQIACAVLAVKPPGFSSPVEIQN